MNVGIKPGNVCLYTASATNRQLLIRTALSLPDAENPCKKTTNSCIRNRIRAAPNPGPPKTFHKRKLCRCANAQFLAPPSAAAPWTVFELRAARNRTRLTPAVRFSPPPSFLLMPPQRRSPLPPGCGQGKTAAFYGMRLRSGENVSVAVLVSLWSHKLMCTTRAGFSP